MCTEWMVESCKYENGELCDSHHPNEHMESGKQHSPREPINKTYLITNATVRMSHSNQSIICCNNSSIVQLHNRLTNPRTHTHTLHSTGHGFSLSSNSYMFKLHTSDHMIVISMWICADCSDLTVEMMSG